MMPQIHLTITFNWYPWTSWNDLVSFKKHQARGPVPACPGVYEIRRVDADPDELLYLGSSKKLSTRLYDDLLNDQGGAHATHKKQLFWDEVGGNTQLLALRWAETEPCHYLALECELLRQYTLQFGHFPKFVQR